MFHLQICTCRSVVELTVNASSCSLRPFRTVMKSVPHMGQGTSSYAPTASNSKVSLHPAQVKIMGFIVVFMLFTPV